MSFLLLQRKDNGDDIKVWKILPRQQQHVDPEIKFLVETAKGNEQEDIKWNSSEQKPKKWRSWSVLNETVTFKFVSLSDYSGWSIFYNDALYSDGV